MKCSVDLHIHTALSPCADDDMTPNNIVNMAKLKGLDIIAITDHNSIRNCEAVMTCASSQDILVIPGMELETNEEVHILCLFPSLESAREFQSIVDFALPSQANREDLFGRQLLLNEADEIIGCEEQLLLTATRIPLHDAVRFVRLVGGVVIPAHINRPANSIISNLGLIPDELAFTTVEIASKPQDFDFEQHVPGKYRLLQSSDAHHLGDILERVSFMELYARNITALLEVLNTLPDE